MKLLKLSVIQFETYYTVHTMLERVSQLEMCKSWLSRWATSRLVCSPLIDIFAVWWRLVSVLTHYQIILTCPSLSGPYLDQVIRELLWELFSKCLSLYWSSQDLSRHYRRKWRMLTQPDGPGIIVAGAAPCLHRIESKPHTNVIDRQNK